MFRKVNTPVLGVVENMSGLNINGQTDPDNPNLQINGEKVSIDSDGTFSINLDLFKTGGGKKESERLGVPLLGKIPISEQIMSSTDLGNTTYCARLNGWYRWNIYRNHRSSFISH